jgi:hypothetical protein
MTLRTDLAALLADAGITGVDVDEAAKDEHVRSSIYRKVIAVAVASRCRANDRAVAATILRDPIETVAKTAVVELVDRVAMGTADPAEFQQWAAELVPEISLLKAEGHRGFVRRRIHDWTVYLTIRADRTLNAGELTMARPSAFAVTSAPAAGMETWRSVAIRFSTPTTSISAPPVTNMPRNSVASARFVLPWLNVACWVLMCPLLVLSIWSRRNEPARPAKQGASPPLPGDGAGVVAGIVNRRFRA